MNASRTGSEPTGMSVRFLVLVFTSIVDTEALPPLVTKAVLPSGVTATHLGCAPTAMSVRCFFLVLTSIVDTVPLPLLGTKTVLPSGRSVRVPGEFVQQLALALLGCFHHVEGVLVDVTGDGAWKIQPRRLWSRS